MSHLHWHRGVEQIDGQQIRSRAEINAYLGTSAETLPELVQQLAERRSGRRLKVGDAFCGRGLHPVRGRGARLRCLCLGPQPRGLPAHLACAQRYRGQRRHGTAGARPSARAGSSRRRPRRAAACALPSCAGPEEGAVRAPCAPGAALQRVKHRHEPRSGSKADSPTDIQGVAGRSDDTAHRARATAGAAAARAAAGVRPRRRAAPGSTIYRRCMRCRPNASRPEPSSGTSAAWSKAWSKVAPGRA